MKTIIRSCSLLIASLVFLGVTQAMAAPTLTVGSVSSQAGTSIDIPVTLNPGTDSVATLQFDLTLPPALTANTVTAGAILTSAGKSVGTNVIGSTWRFIIFGLNQTA